MDIYDFRKDLIQEVKATAENSKDSTTASFVNVMAGKLYNSEVILDYIPAFFTGFGKNNRKLRCDAYAIDEWDNTITLIVADYDGTDEEKTLTRTEANNFFGRTQALIEEILLYGLKNKLEISMPIYDLTCDLLRLYQNNSTRKIKIILITDRVASSRISNLAGKELNSIQLEFHVWDINRFYKIESSETAKQDIEIDFTEYIDKGIPCLEASATSTSDLVSYLCVIPGKVLADIYDKYGSLLLEGNVRSFLSVRGKVNKAIRSTIINQERSPMFFCLNNGISVTANKVVIKRTSSGTFLRYVYNMQIVNGGQTTASLSNTRFKDKINLEGIYVQMKLTEVTKEKSEELIPLISKSANSQNKVNEADFFSNHPFHIRFEEFSRRKYAPAVSGAQYETHWFYERARGQYTQMQMRKTKSEVKKFKLQNPKNQVITKTDLAKVVNSWSGRPDIVSKGAQASFLFFANSIDVLWEKDDSIFNEVYFQEAVSLYILFKHVERLVSKQDWYEGGYRANIVTYSIALFSENIKRNYKDSQFNLMSIWIKQQVPLRVNEYFTEITKKVFTRIVSGCSTGMNITQWCKREGCWNSIKYVDVDLSSVEEYLLSKSEIKESDRKARKEQRMLNGIEAQIFIVELGKEYWSEMLEWGSKLQLLSKEDKKNLALASKMSSSKMPNTVQCFKLQKVRNRMMNEGFRSK